MAAYRVLVVEDNHEVALMVTASIKTLGADIDVLDVPSAEEALLISTTLPVDLVVLDIRLPGMSGLEMVTKLRKRKPETKIILVTGVEDEGIRQQVSEAGTEAYFFKPIAITTFLDVVKRSLWSTPGEPGLPSSGEDRIAAIPPTKRVERGAPEISVVTEPTTPVPTPTLTECLAGLKQQVKAVSTLLVNDAGQVIAEAGSATEITTGSALLSALMQAFSASLQVSQAMAKGTRTSLQYFAARRECLYVTPVGQKHALFVVTTGFFDPDKLSMIDHAIQDAVRDLQAILASNSMEMETEQTESEKLRTDLLAEVTVDQETLAGVEDMFSKASRTSNARQADGFWETVPDSVSLSGGHGKNVLSYDQARDLGLAPEEGKGA
jgi:DNA-binding response OmpR family regulator